MLNYKFLQLKLQYISTQVLGVKLFKARYFEKRICIISTQFSGVASEMEHFENFSCPRENKLGR